jgi:transcriptional regulator with XRE-family HTH domain
MGGQRLGEQVRKLRENRGLTQAQLAERIGMSTIFIRKLESGERLASIVTLERLAEALGATLRIDLIERGRRR